MSFRTMELLLLPTSVLANILGHLGDAGEVVRASTACRALWTAAAAPLPNVQALTLRCRGPDLEPQLLQRLQHRFPNIQQLCVADGCWWWTGRGGSLAAWAAQLTVLQANCTSIPLAAVAVAPTAQQVSQEGTTAAADPQPTVATEQQPQQLQLWPTSAAVPPELRGLVHLELQHTVTRRVTCRQHRSSNCACMEHTVLATLLKQNSGLKVLNLGGNSDLPDGMLHAAVLAATCSTLHTLNLSGCALVAPKGHVLAAAFPALQCLDLSDTATGDAELQALLAGLPLLKTLRLKGCRRVSGLGVDALAAAPALLTGHLTHLELGGPTRPQFTDMTALASAWAHSAAADSSAAVSNKAGGSGSCADDALSGLKCGVQLHVGFSRTAGITDQVLQAFAAAAAPVCSNTSNTSSSSSKARVEGAEAACDGTDDLQPVLQQLQTLSLSAAGESTASTTGAEGVKQGEMQQQQQQVPGNESHAQQVPQVLQQPRFSLVGLHIAGSNALTSEALLQLGATGALDALTSLDIADTEAFRHPVSVAGFVQQQHLLQLPSAHPQDEAAGQHKAVTGSHSTSSSSSDREGCSASSSAAAAVSRSALPQLLQHTGRCLRVLLLDGCFLDDAGAATLAAQGLPQLQELSLVGCRGVKGPGLRQLLGSLPSLKHLSLGGSVMAATEGDVLLGLPMLGQLTQLQLIRRPALTDAELAPVLAAASSLQSLWLVGCYMLTDKVFEFATTAAAAPAACNAVGCAAQDPAAEHQGGAAAAAGVTDGLCGLGLSDGSPQDVRGLLPLQQLTQLCITACDGLTGSSIARLQGLKHLRASFCASVSAGALQHLIVSCGWLQLLELPARLSSLGGLGFRAVRFEQPGSASAAGRQGAGKGARGGRAGVARHTGGGMVLPLQGATHAQDFCKRLKIVWL